MVELSGGEISASYIAIAAKLSVKVGKRSTDLCQKLLWLYVQSRFLCLSRICKCSRLYMPLIMVYRASLPQFYTLFF